MSSQKQSHRKREAEKTYADLVKENAELRKWKSWAMSKPAWWRPWAVRKWKKEEPK